MLRETTYNSSIGATVPAKERFTKIAGINDFMLFQIILNKALSENRFILEK